MKGIINACLTHDRATLLVLIIIFIIGVTQYIETPKELSPDVQVPMIFVSTSLRGISPSDSDRLLVKPMENVLRGVSGVKEMRSSATDGVGHTILEFDAGFDSDKALDEVRAKVDDIVSDLPEDASRPVVTEINLSLFPVLSVGLVGELPERELISMARALKKEIESLPNVLSVDIAGTRDEILEVIVEPRIMSGYDLRVEEILQAINNNNQLIAAGELNNGYSIKVNGVLQDMMDVANLPIRGEGSGVVRIKDIAEIRPTFKDRAGFARVNGGSAVVLEISKRSGKNLIETVDQVKQVVEIAKQFLPPNLEIIYSLDQSKTINDVLSDLQNNILMAIVLVLFVIMYAMGFRQAFMIALAIPGSFYIGIIILAQLGMTMNIVVLFSLIMSIGMLVDAAIVVNEYADRKMIVGMSSYESYKLAAIRMSFPIIASTATTLVVFVPLLFWPGVVGQFMKYLPLTLIATLTGSLLMSLIFTPTLGAIFGKASTNDPVLIARMKALDDGEVDSLGPLMKKYSRWLLRVLAKPKRFVLIIVAVLVASILSYAIFGAGFEFFPKVEPESAMLTVRSQGNFSVEERDKMLRMVEGKVLNVSDEIKVVYARSGKFSGQRFSSDDIVGTVHMEFVNWQFRRRVDSIISDIQEATKDIDGIVVEFQEDKQGPDAGGKPIRITVSSLLVDELYPATDYIVKTMEKIGGFTNISDTRSSPEIQWEIDVDRNKALLAGLSVRLIGEYIKMITSGVKIGSYRPSDVEDEVDILLRLPDERRGISELDNLRVNGIYGPTTISNLIDLKATNKIKKLDRENSLPVLSIAADVERGLLVDEQIKKLQKELIRYQAEINPNVKVAFKGETADQEESKAFLSRAFVLSLMGVVMILVVQFNSYYYALIIMTAVFLSTSGVLIGLLITGNTFLVTMCGVGIIALTGIVVNNNILLIDAFNINLKAGLKYKDAIVKASLSRVKPILLTAGTTMLGLLPMVLKITINFFDGRVSYDAPSSQWWVHLSTTIGGGLAFATVLTLFFTPALLMLGKKKRG